MTLKDTTAGGVEAVALYRFLELGDLIEAGDECPSDNCERWEAVNRWAVGMPRSSIFKIIRRRVAASPAPAPAAEVEEKSHRLTDAEKAWRARPAPSPKAGETG